MIDRAALLADLSRQLRLLERDLAGRAEVVPAMAATLEAEYRAARRAERTGDTFGAWRGGELTQAAVAWLLGCVFVRFVEDNGLLATPLIGGPGDRTTAAEARQTAYFRAHPTATDRDYLLDVFSEVSRLPATTGLYDRARNPVWRYTISGDAARDLLAFWRAVDPDTGALHHDFTDLDWDTRFLGDLYQDLSDDAKKRYALLQTPEFVEAFILDRTLTPALDEFGLPAVRLIDPACGSGHFLLGAFHRLLRIWFSREPATPERVLVQRALDSVAGVDLNPFAVAIARFRLLVAALRASRIQHLRDAPAFAIHVAAGDSLLHGRRFGELDLGSADAQLADHEGFGHAFQAEDPAALNRILGRRYHVVVGNPPYITAKDRAVSQLYRARYATCHMKYAMSVPFTERFFNLALPGSERSPAGHVGMITANSFMKREFGRKLVEEFFPRVDLTHVIDASGAYIPGHGTPTVLLFGRHRDPVDQTVRLAMGRRGEPATPEDPARGTVWTAITDQIDRAHSESEWISVADSQRADLAVHPWLLGGGDAVLLLQTIDRRDSSVLGRLATAIGIVAISGQDDFFSRPHEQDFRRIGIRDRRTLRPLVAGDEVRDWAIRRTSTCLFDYDSRDSFRLGSVVPSHQTSWRYRTTLGVRATFSKLTYFEEGRPWYEWHQVVFSRLDGGLTIAFADVATHNHFVLDRGGKVFNRHAPVIKLPKDASEADHLGLLGLLNSSMACFWLKQVSHNKGSTIDAKGARQTTDAFENFYDFNVTTLKRFPLPAERPLKLATSLDRLATERQAHLPAQLAERFPLTPAELDLHRAAADDLLARMIALQEELDWQCCGLYGIIDPAPYWGGDAGHRGEPPPLRLGERAFEIVVARGMAQGSLDTTWFARHDATPITDLPEHWPTDYRVMVEQRIKLIESDRFIGLIERPEYKRRWNVEPWEVQEKRALRRWLLDRLESPSYWPDRRLRTVRDLADRAAADAAFQQVAARHAGSAGVDLARLVGELVAGDHVPVLPVQRYRASGLAKRAEWELTWQHQRREDAIAAEAATAARRNDRESVRDHGPAENEMGTAPPPKYRSADFLKTSYWRLRGALDVPKERFVSLPDMSRDSDPSLLVGWAGWDAPSLCQAVAAYYTEVQQHDGWSPARLTPLLTVLHENLPWLKQWHNDIDPEYDQRLGDFYETFLRSELASLGLTEEDLRAWMPANTAKSRRRV